MALNFNPAHYTRLWQVPRVDPIAEWYARKAKAQSLICQALGVIENLRKLDESLLHRQIWQALNTALDRQSMGD